MSVMTAEHVVVPNADTVVVNENREQVSFWNRFTGMIKSAGNKVVSVAKGFAGWIADRAKDLWNSKAVQWVASKAKWAAGKAWGVAKGPVGWIGGGLAAVIFAPKAVAIMTFVGVVAVVGIGYGVYKLVKNPEKFKAFTNRVEQKLDVIEANMGEIEVMFNGDVIVGETVESRQEYLENLLNDANARNDDGAISELNARLWLLNVRQGRGGKIKRDASTSVIHRANRDFIEADPHKATLYKWDWARMYHATRAEDKRLKDIEALKAGAAPVVIK